jgi:hypothetical protein
LGCRLLANHMPSREQIDYSTINDFGAEGVEEAFSRGNRIVSHVRRVVAMLVGSGTSYSQDVLVAANPIGTETPYPQDVLMDGGVDDDGIGNPADYYHGKDDEEVKFGHESNGSSPSALKYEMNGGRSFAQAISDTIHVSANPFLIRAGEWQSTGMAPQITSPPSKTPKKKSTLRSTSFTPVVMTPPPTLDNAIDVDPNFFEGSTQDGAGPGPHFLTMSLIKDKSNI